MRASLKKRSSLISFILVIIVSGFAGGIIGFCLQFSHEGINLFLNNAKEFFNENMISIQLIMFIVVTLSLLLIQAKARKNIYNITDDDNHKLEKAETLLSFSLALTTIFNIFCFLSLFFLIYFDLKVQNHMFGTLIFVVSLLVNVYFEVASVKLTQRINPFLKGDPLKFNFQKEFVESCDEAEKHIMFVSSFKSFKILKNAFIFTMVILMLLQTITDIGLAAPITVAILWAIHSLSYTIVSHRASYPKK